MGLGLSQIITVAKLASDVLGGSREGGGTQQLEIPEFSIDKRDMQKPQDPGEVKASEAISYEELNRIWDRILPNAYAEIIKTTEQPAFSPKRDIT
jgi:hypothetical protein|tara:strand:+ start:1401 stop:1685 length:285 start_codon:yes stop_codon:yes gene_type:complete